MARFVSLLFAALVLMATGCSPSAGVTVVPPSSPAPVATSTTVSFSNPFAYCAAVGTVDVPDARYTGEKIPDQIIAGFKQAAGMQSSTEPMDMLKQTTIWRCMGGKVYACNYGANLPCDSKADTAKTPTQAMQDYCRANPDSDFIPMSVTGHSIIYSWHCDQDTAHVLDQIGKVDAAGYLQQIWYPIQPTP